MMVSASETSCTIRYMMWCYQYAVRPKWNAYRECHWLGGYPMSMSSTVDHRLRGSPLRSPWRIERSSITTAESIHGSVELLGSSGASGVLGWGGNSQSWTHCGQLTGSRGIVCKGACGWITCNLRGMWLWLMSCGTSGEVAGQLVKEKVGGEAGIITWAALNYSTGCTCISSAIIQNYSASQ